MSTIPPIDLRAASHQRGVGLKPDVVADGVGQLWIKGLQQVQHSIHEKQRVVIAVQHPLVGVPQRLACAAQAAC